MKGSERSLVLFLVFAFGIIGCYSLYGIVQEGLRKVQPDGTKFTHTALLLVAQCFLASLFAAILDPIASWLNPSPPEAAAKAKPPLHTTAGLQAVVEVSLTYLGAMWASNEALAYVAYPVQVVAKSCKMIPVMIGEVVVQKKTHPFYKYVCVVVMAAGVVLFQLRETSPKKLKAESAHGLLGWLGIGLLFLSLALDAYTGPRQKVMKKNFEATSLRFMALQNLLSGFIALGALGLWGGIMPGVQYLLDHPALIWEVLKFSALSAVGQAFIFGMLFYFDALLLTTVTTFRKFLTILFSVFVHGHTLTALHWLAIIMVFGSMTYDQIIVPYMNTASKTPLVSPKDGGTSGSSPAGQAPAETLPEPTTPRADGPRHRQSTAQNEA